MENLFLRLRGRLYAIVRRSIAVGIPWRFVIWWSGWWPGGFATTESQSLWMAEGLGSSGWNWRCRNSLLSVCSVWLVVWAGLCRSAFWWAEVKSGVSCSLVYPLWVRRVKSSMDFCLMSSGDEHSRWIRRMLPWMRPESMPDGWAEWGGM